VSSLLQTALSVLGELVHLKYHGKKGLSRGILGAGWAEEQKKEEKITKFVLQNQNSSVIICLNFSVQERKRFFAG
jgi:hypothetical protein